MRGAGNGPPPPCDLTGLLTAGPYTPPTPVSVGAVDARVKSLAFTIITAGSGATPGVGSAGNPNTAQARGGPLVPLGGLLRLAFHDSGTYVR